MSLALRNSSDVGALIRDRRRARGLSQQALADAIGVSRLWVGQVERGRPRAELGLVLKALGALGVRLTADSQPDAVTGPDLDAIVQRSRKPKR
jgi:HTH-type transcriptional regulator/antitoxin HipB